MANTFSPPSHSTLIPFNAPKTAEMRRAEREEKKLAKRRFRERLQQMARTHPIRYAAPQTDGPRKRPLIDPERQLMLAQRFIARWYPAGPEAPEPPMVMFDVRYWEARACGWEPLEGRTVDDAPALPVSDWYYDWWLELHYETRRQFVRLFWSSENVAGALPLTGAYVRRLVLGDEKH
jgi:hypothetical protein